MLDDTPQRSPTSRSTPLLDPDDCGENLTVIVRLSPGASTNGNPATLNPAPATLPSLIVKAASPLLVSVIVVSREVVQPSSEPNAIANGDSNFAR
jgi:hypothetical protein